ncbi:sensor histidine kinase [Jiella mangrovi]|uniref:Blue-light-activated histidine kinase n=1 Tax=Jiella mangrovi TaxID=2821407 RepID=A0ABS4BKE7_9HYPH|nr:GAF domain-containing protein [Jiella mangrovi]
MKSGLLAHEGAGPFERIVDLACDVFDIPTALFTLVGDDFQVYLTQRGLDAGQPCDEKSAFKHSLCRQVAVTARTLAISDAAKDAVTAGNPNVETFGIGAYLGVPVRLPTGEVIGSLAVISSDPYHWSDREVRRLETLSSVLEDEIRVRVGETKWRNLFDKLVEGFVLAEAIRGETGRLVDWMHVEVNDAYGKLVGIERADARGKKASELFPDLEAGWRDDFAKVVDEQEVVTFIRHVSHNGRWYEGSAQPLSDDRFVVLFIDVTARMEEQTRRADMQRETEHRLKNSLAVVASIARQTFRCATSIEDARDTLLGRIDVLTRAHLVLHDGGRGGGAIAAVLETAFAPFAGKGRMEMNGPAVVIGPQSATNLALVTHELATNAAKYGALSSESGRVDIDWWIEQADGEAILSLNWCERGGPPARQPERLSIGTRLIKAGLQVAGGHCEIRYEPEGLVCELRAPLKAIQAR